MPFSTRHKPVSVHVLRHKNHVFIFSSNTQTSVQQGQIQNSHHQPTKEPMEGTSREKPEGIVQGLKTLGLMLAGEILRSERYKTQIDRDF